VDPKPSESDDLTRRRRVLHITTTFCTWAGSAENTRLTVNLLPRDRYEVYLAVPPSNEAEPSVADHVQRISIPDLERSIRPWRDFKTFLHIYALCRKWRFDVVHTHNSKDGILGRWAARLAGVPVVVHTIHNISFRAAKYALINRLYLVLERLTAKVTTLLFAVSSENVREYRRRGVGTANQYRVVYSGLELNRYAGTLSRSEARRRLGLPLSAPIVGWFGRFNPQKDPLTFVRAAEQVMRALPGLQCVLCGNEPFGGDLSRRVRQLAHQLGILNRMHFLGFREDLPSIIPAVDVVMHSSRYEGMGRIVCEALLCGRPVAGTDVDGVREVIVSGVRGGILVPPGNAEALANVAVRLIQDEAYAQELAMAGREWVKAHLSAENMVNEIDASYEVALGIRKRTQEHVPQGVPLPKAS